MHQDENRAVSPMVSAIEAALENLEEAVAKHPAATTAVYASGCESFLESKSSGDSIEWLRSIGLTSSENQTVHRFLVSSSFISSWYFLRVDEMSQLRTYEVASRLLSGLDDSITAEEIHTTFSDYEWKWQRRLRKIGIHIAFNHTPEDKEWDSELRQTGLFREPDDSEVSRAEATWSQLISGESPDRTEMRQAVMFAIAEGLRDAEEAITSHPEPLRKVYEQGRDAFLRSAATVTEHTEWSQSTGLSLDELRTVRQYLLACSFIAAAWRYIAAQPEKQNEATLIAVRLVSGLGQGYEADGVIQQFAELEISWKADLLKLAGTRGSGCVGAVLLILLTGTTVLSLVLTAFRYH